MLGFPSSSAFRSQSQVFQEEHEWVHWNHITLRYYGDSSIIYHRNLVWIRMLPICHFQLINCFVRLRVHSIFSINNWFTHFVSIPNLHLGDFSLQPIFRLKQSLNNIHGSIPQSNWIGHWWLHYLLREWADLSMLLLALHYFHCWPIWLSVLLFRNFFPADIRTVSFVHWSFHINDSNTQKIKYFTFFSSSLAYWIVIICTVNSSTFDNLVLSRCFPKIIAILFKNSILVFQLREKRGRALI